MDVHVQCSLASVVLAQAGPNQHDVIVANQKVRQIIVQCGA